MSKSLALKKRRRLIFDVIPVVYAPNLPEDDLNDEEVELVHSEAELLHVLQEESGRLTSDQRAEVQAIIEGAKALGQLSELEDDDQLQPVARIPRPRGRNL